MTTQTADLVFSSLMQGCAAGISRSETVRVTCEHYGSRLTVGELSTLADEVREDCLAQGIEREDIDPSWF